MNGKRFPCILLEMLWLQTRLVQNILTTLNRCPNLPIRDVEVSPCIYEHIYKPHPFHNALLSFRFSHWYQTALSWDWGRLRTIAICKITERALAREVMQSPPSVCPSVRLFPLYLRNWLTIDLELLCVSRSWQSRSQVKVMGQANAVGPTSIESSSEL